MYACVCTHTDSTEHTLGQVANVGLFKILCMFICLHTLHTYIHIYLRAGDKYRLVDAMKHVYVYTCQYAYTHAYLRAGDKSRLVDIRRSLFMYIDVNLHTYIHTCTHTLGRVTNADLLMRRSTGKAGTAPEAFPKDTKMPRLCACVCVCLSMYDAMKICVFVHVDCVCVFGYVCMYDAMKMCVCICAC
jgi:hypothetical protein